MPDKEAAIVVVDVDGTLVKEGRASRLLFKLALFFQRQGRRMQHPNQALIWKLNAAPWVVVLTSRDEKDSASTIAQLQRAGLLAATVVFLPKADVMAAWKTSMVDDLRHGETVAWIDDMFEDSSIRKTALSAGLLVMTPGEALAWLD